MADIKIYGTLKNVTNEPIANAEQIGNLSTVATSGSYNDLDDKPTIPTNTSDLNNDSGFLTEHQDISGKANTSDLAKVATSGSYNDLNDKPTIQELATVKQLYALDATNPDYPGRIGKYAPFNITSVFGTISIVTHDSNGTEKGLSDVRAEGFTEAQYTIDNTTYTSYYKDSKYYYLGIKVHFFIANIEQYGNDYTFGVIKFTSTQNGVFKVHSIGITPSNCTITVNGVVTQSLMSDMVAVQVNEGDVVKVISLRTDDYYVKILGFVLEGNCGVSVFVNDAGYLTAHQDITGKADKVSNPTEGNFAALDSNGNLTDSGHKHSDYQPTLVSGTNIKTINNNSIIGSGNLSVGTITGITMNGGSKGTSGVVDLGTVLTATTSFVTNGSTTPITSGGVYTALQNYETKLAFITSSITNYSAQRNVYCRFTTTLSSLNISLPTSYLVAGDTCALNFTTSSSFSSFTISGGTIKRMKGFAIEASKTYEVVALYNGSKWLITATEFE